MACHDESCAAVQGVEMCLTCGHSYCANHRGEQDGLVVCSACLKAAHEQRAARKIAAADPSSAQRPRLPSERSEPIRVELPPPEPPGAWALPWALVAALPAAGYMWWLLNWLGQPPREPLPAWLPPLGAALGGGFVAFSVWVIAKSKMSSRPSA